MTYHKIRSQKLIHLRVGTEPDCLDVDFLHRLTSMIESTTITIKELHHKSASDLLEHPTKQIYQERKGKRKRKRKILLQHE